MPYSDPEKRREAQKRLQRGEKRKITQRRANAKYRASLREMRLAERPDTWTPERETKPVPDPWAGVKYEDVRHESNPKRETIGDAR
jgi:hypothetical protein